MSYLIYPVEEDECVFLSYEVGISALEMSAARYEANAVLEHRHWKRMVIDVTQLRSVLTPMELFDFARVLSSETARRLRIALVVLPEQERHAKFVETIARTRHVFLTHFFDPEQATDWVKQTGSFGPECVGKNQKFSSCEVFRPVC